MPDSREMRLAAATLVIPPRGVLVGLTAAWVYGADVRRDGDLDVHAGFPEGTRIRGRPGLVVSQETLAPSDIWVISGMSVTSPVRTAFDCLRLLKGAERLVVADALTHLRRTTVEELRRYFAGQRRLRNLRVAELLLDDIEPKSESPMETRLRVGLVGCGLPRPEAQVDVFSSGGAFIGRVDLAYVDARLAVEYDGAWHWERRRQDDRRRAALRAAGWEVLVFSAEDLKTTDLVAAQVRAALRGRRQAG